jgi:uncharacterized protein (DUF302 family)
MYYIVDSEKTVDEAVRALEAAVKKHGFGVLHVYDLKQTLAGKGVRLPEECRIYEVCNPQQAIRVLTADMSLNMALPCRISVYQQDGKTRIGTMRPTEILGLVSTDPKLAEIAGEVDETLEAIIDEAA